jgi:transposase
LSSAEKEALIVTLLARIEELSSRLAALEEENAALRAKLNLPPKTPDNSSTPPSQGRKASSAPISNPKGKLHAGAHRPLHPNPTWKRDVLAEQCQHCGISVAGAPQAACEAYDRIEIPRITPDVTRVTLYGGTCPGCAKRFKAVAPPGLEPGSPFGPNLRAFALYLRFTHAISFERLCRLFSDLIGLDISEGALVNVLDDSGQAFARQTILIRAKLLAGTILDVGCNRADRSDRCRHSPKTDTRFRRTWTCVKPCRAKLLEV